MASVSHTFFFLGTTWFFMKPSLEMFEEWTSWLEQEWGKVYQRYRHIRICPKHYLSSWRKGNKMSPDFSCLPALPKWIWNSGNISQGQNEKPGLERATQGLRPLATLQEDLHLVLQMVNSQQSVLTLVWQMRLSLINSIQKQNHIRKSRGLPLLLDTASLASNHKDKASWHATGQNKKTKNKKTTV